MHVAVSIPMWLATVVTLTFALASFGVTLGEAAKTSSDDFRILAGIGLTIVMLALSSGFGWLALKIANG